MKRWSGIARTVALSAALCHEAGPALAQPSPMSGTHRMPGPMAQHHAGEDPAFHDDMHLVHAMLRVHANIKRVVTNLPDGILTVTESDDPKVAQLINAHVASMEKRLAEGRVFNLFSATLPVLFANQHKILTAVERSATGSTVRQTSSDPVVVAALQAHAAEVSELARDGMAAMMRNMKNRGARH